MHFILNYIKWFCVLCNIFSRSVASLYVYPSLTFLAILSGSIFFVYHSFHSQKFLTLQKQFFFIVHISSTAWMNVILVCFIHARSLYHKFIRLPKTRLKTTIPRIGNIIRQYCWNLFTSLSFFSNKCHMLIQPLKNCGVN